MSRWAGRLEACENCGLVYEKMKTGLSFKDVRNQLWSGSAETEDWKYKRRHTVLGLWHQIKKQLWEEHLRWCEEASQRAKEAAESLPEDPEELAEVLRRFTAVQFTDVPF